MEVKKHCFILVRQQGAHQYFLYWIIFRAVAVLFHMGVDQEQLECIYILGRIFESCGILHLAFFLLMAIKNCKGKNDIACHAQEPVLVHMAALDLSRCPTGLAPQQRYPRPQILLLVSWHIFAAQILLPLESKGKILLTSKTGWPDLEVKPNSMCNIYS